MLDNSILRNKDKVCSGIKANLRSPQGDLPACHRLRLRPLAGRSPTGFSLLEVMVAVVILGFGLLAIMHLFPIGLRASRISYNTSQASFYAQKKMEELRNTGWSSIAAETKSGISGTIFSQRVTVNVAVSDLLKEVTVSVFWTDYGAERKVELVTYMVDYKKKFT